MKTGDSDTQSVSARSQHDRSTAQSAHAYANGTGTRPNAPERTTSVRLPHMSPLDNIAQDQQLEIFIVFADGEVCSRLASELRRIPNLSVVGQFDTVEAFLLHLMRNPIARGTQPFVVSQLAFSGMSGVEGLTQIHKLEPTMKTIFVGDDPGAATLIHLWRQGAADFLLQPLSIQEISQSILRSIEREKPPNRAITRTASNPEALKLMTSLTKRELEIFKLVVKGLLNKEIAKALHISLPTVKMHRANLMRKLNLDNAVQLVSFYHENIVQASN